MSYKSILTIVSEPGASMRPLVSAIDIARREDAHLEVLCLGIDRNQTGYYYGGAIALLHQEALNQAQAAAEEAERVVRERLSAEDIRWSIDTGVAQLGAVGSAVAARARYNDLVVLGKPYGPQTSGDKELIVEAALFDGATPVLIVPEQEVQALAPRRVVVAWNQSAEAMVAVRRALPILKRADIVDILIIDPPASGPERSDPGGQLSQLLARHGVKAEVTVLARTMPRISDIINRHARESGADLVVMGAYSHSRFREAILGGATRYMLEQAELPVFMAH